MNVERLGPVARVAAGTDLGATLQSHAPVLLAAARAITLDDVEAQDLVQTTFEIALRRIGQLRDPEALRAWLLRIEAREAFRLTRRLGRMGRLNTGVTQIPIGGADATEALAVRQALRALPIRMRAAVVLHHMVGLSVAETAEALGTSPNTVKSQLKSGLARLRELLVDA